MEVNNAYIQYDPTSFYPPNTNSELFTFEQSRGYIRSGLFAPENIISYAKRVSLADVPSRNSLTVVDNKSLAEVVDIINQLPPLDWTTGRYLEESHHVIETNRRQKPLFDQQY